ncbi:hypothetical protein FOL47_008741 [Perkinsus chesapeaki]|uniref:Uncharacterized protein n=1 Tax=Perkinsus chesapeaki TaxID=330153 RepID=A0A7J6LCH9_PERCH|nr:hypothetical protein FOL47_008741 [Perkinsus chesapeaki]
MMSPSTAGYRKISLILLTVGVEGRRLLTSHKQQSSPNVISLDEFEKRFVGSLELSDDCYITPGGDMVDSARVPEDIPEHNQGPSDVFCHFRGLGEALCVAKKRDGDFTDMFMYNSTADKHGGISSETRSCEVLTNPPIVSVDKMKQESSLLFKGCGVKKAQKRDVWNDMKKLAWRKIRKALKDTYRNMRMIDNEGDGKQIERTHLLIMPCDIDQPKIDFMTSVAYENPIGGIPDKFNLFFTGRDGHHDQTYTFRRLIPQDVGTDETTSEMRDETRMQTYVSTRPAYTAVIQEGLRNGVPRRKALKFTEEIGGEKVEQRIKRKHTTVDNGIVHTVYTIGDNEGEAFTFLHKKQNFRAMVVFRHGKWAVLQNAYKPKYNESLDVNHLSLVLRY